jgi:hypothetical protein
MMRAASMGADLTGLMQASVINCGCSAFYLFPHTRNSTPPPPNPTSTLQHVDEEGDDDSDDGSSTDDRPAASAAAQAATGLATTRSSNHSAFGGRRASKGGESSHVDLGSARSADSHEGAPAGDAAAQPGSGSGDPLLAARLAVEYGMLPLVVAVIRACMVRCLQL